MEINPHYVLSSLVHYHTPSRASFWKESSFNANIRLCLNLFFAGCFRALITPHRVHLRMADFRGERVAFVFIPGNICVFLDGVCLRVVELIRCTVP